MIPLAFSNNQTHSAAFYDRKDKRFFKFCDNLLCLCTTTSCIDINYYTSIWLLCQKHGAVHIRGGN